MSAVQIVTPHLVVRDANAALEFYKKALGATETVRMPAQDGKRLMHSEIQVSGARIFVDGDDNRVALSLRNVDRDDFAAEGT